MVITFQETYKTAAVSMAHMRKEDGDVLKTLSMEAFSLVAMRPTGFFVKLHTDEVTLNHCPQLSPELNAVLVHAAMQGFSCIEFDEAADRIDSLTVFDW